MRPIESFINRNLVSYRLLRFLAWLWLWRILLLFDWKLEFLEIRYRQRVASSADRLIDVVDVGWLDALPVLPTLTKLIARAKRLVVEE